jgi:transcriptional regulator with XRE-family HTH domain
MKIENQLTDRTILQELGKRVRAQRLALNLTQSQLAEEAGVGRATVNRLERGACINLSCFIRILRVLGLVEALEILIPENVISPIAALKLRGRQRQRASGSRGENSADAPITPWTWNEK